MVAADGGGQLHGPGRATLAECRVRPAALAGSDVRAEVVLDGDVVPFGFRLIGAGSRATRLAWTAEAQAAIGLIPAMRSGRPLRVAGELDAGFRDNLDFMQTMLRCWNKDWRSIEIRSDRLIGHPAGHGARKALFFTGGVDSFFSLLRHAPTLTDLVFVHGYDVPLHDTALRAALSAYLRDIAAAFSLNLIEIETDVRNLLDRHASWLYAHGPAIGVVGHLLSGCISEFVIASTYSYANLLPCGTHPLMDPRWSTPRTRFVHDAAECSRTEKLVVIAAHAVARRNLRVCYTDPRPGFLNCCRCEKCVRTMVALRALDALHPDEAFGQPLDMRCVRAGMLDEVIRGLWVENRDLLRQTGADPWLLADVEALLEPHPLRRLRARFRVLNRHRIKRRRSRRQQR